ncbi:MAG TPA: hypothetical protein PLH15_03345 [Spirochaetota bacterium]|nr:hypothetical protein [Spirochaetota bacterium]
MRIIIFLAFLVSVSALYSDFGPIVPISGGNVKMIKNDDVQMSDEIIIFHLYRDHYTVEVNYTFVNEGKSQEVVMGFPNSEGKWNTQSIMNFKAYENDKELVVFRKNDSEKNVDKENMEEQRYYECSKLFFKEGEKKAIKNTYEQVYESEYDSTFMAVNYILKTGSYWKKNIKSIKVFAYFENITPEDLQKRFMYFTNDSLKSGGEVVYNFEVTPNKYKFENNILSMNLTDVEPDFDIRISFSALFYHNAEASSELKSKNEQYDAKNVIDNNLSTAWVEGVIGSGINENIKIDFAPYTAGGKIEGSTLINKIGIINGYSKDKDTFKSNNRVKKIRITYNYRLGEDEIEGRNSNPKEKVLGSLGISEFNDQELRYKEKILGEYLLKDKMEMQYIQLDEPLLASYIKITILDVYKGEKFNDTCISEVKVITEKKNNKLK